MPAYQWIEGHSRSPDCSSHRSRKQCLLPSAEFFRYDCGDLGHEELAGRVSPGCIPGTDWVSSSPGAEGDYRLEDIPEKMLLYPTLLNGALYRSTGNAQTRKRKWRQKNQQTVPHAENFPCYNHVTITCSLPLLKFTRLSRHRLRSLSCCHSICFRPFTAVTRVQIQSGTPILQQLTESLILRTAVALLYTCTVKSCSATQIA